MWIKYLIGAAIGVAASFIIPISSVQAQNTLNFIVDLVIRVIRYSLIPLIFFSISTAAFKLRQEKLFAKTALWLFGTILFSTIILTALGLLSAWIIKLPRIPITIERVNETPVLDVKNLLTSIFPYSSFETLLNGAFLLPAIVFATLAGAGAAGDENGSKSAMTLFDSLSRVFYHIMNFFTELFAAGLIAIMMKWLTDFLKITSLKVFNPLFIMLTVDLLLVAVVIYPLILRILCHDRHPYRVLFAGIPSFIAAFLSGDSNLVLSLSLRHGKESLGIRRRINSVTFPAYSVFARGGAALVNCVCFILILRSYSSLNITFTNILWIAGMSFILSFALGNIPVGGPFFALTIMFNMYGSGFDAGYLLLKEASPLICCFACAIDSLTAFWGSYIVAVKTENIEHLEVSKFI